MAITADTAVVDSVAQKQADSAAPPAPANDLTFPRKTKFRFNKDEKTGFQRPAVEVDIKVPNVPGIIAFIMAGKQAEAVPEASRTDEQKKAIKSLDYLVEVLGDSVVKEVRGYVSDNTNAAQDTIPWDKFTFDAIANMPAGIRGASGIGKELWDKFAKDYVTVFAANGVTAEVAAARVAVLVQKFRPLTGNVERKTIIENLMATVALYTEKTTSGDEFTSILEFLDKKAEELKKEDTIVTANALGFA